MRQGIATYLSEQKTAMRSALLNFWRKALTSDFVRKVAETIATRALLIGFGLVTTVIIARILGPEGRGLFAVAAALSGIGIQFGNLGLHVSNTYYAAGDKKLLPGLIGNSLAVSFGLVGIGIALAWVMFRIWPQLAPIHGAILIIALAMIPFGLAYQLLQSILIGIMEIRSVNVIELMNRVITVGFLAAVIILNVVMVETVLFISLISLIVCFTWAMGKLRKYVRQIPLPSFTLFKSNLSYGFKAYLGCFFAFVVLRVNLLMVQHMLGAEQSGYYSIATSMADMIYLVPSVIGTILFPKLTSLINVDEKWKIFKDTTFGLILVIVPMVAFSIFLAKPVIILLFGNEFSPAIYPFRLLSLGMIFYGVNNIVGNFLAALGFPWFSVYIWVIILIANILFNLMFLPLYGILGAALSASICYLLLLISQYIYLKRMILHGSTG